MVIMKKITVPRVYSIRKHTFTGDSVEKDTSSSRSHRAYILERESIDTLIRIHTRKYLGVTHAKMKIKWGDVIWSDWEVTLADGQGRPLQGSDSEREM